MNELSSLPPQTDYKDRRAGLIAFGILQILFGLLCVLILIGISVVMLLDPQLLKLFTAQAMGFVVALYGLLALALIWLGIGSIRCRRWARTLTLIGAWSVLLAGILVLIFYGLFGRRMYDAMLSDAASTLAWVLGMLIQAILLVVLPGLMVLFYGSRNVIATCTARDPNTHWTESCPMPVLATSLWFVLSSLSLLILPLFYRSVIPWFGMFVRGAPAAFLLAVCILIGFYLAWGIYRLQMAAWWLCLIFSTVFGMSAVVTFSKVEFIEIYRELGYPPEQIELLRNYSFLHSSMMIWELVVFYVLFIVFLIWVRKYFRGSQAPGKDNAA